jgi:hypothetical protein
MCLDSAIDRGDTDCDALDGKHIQSFEGDLR